MLNPMLQTLIWTCEDRAVAQDWELERGNEGALIWTDLGPDLARMVCENPEVLGILLCNTGALVGSWIRTGENGGTWAWVRSGLHSDPFVGGAEQRGAKLGSRARGWSGNASPLWAYVRMKRKASVFSGVSMQKRRSSVFRAGIWIGAITWAQVGTQTHIP